MGVPFFHYVGVFLLLAAWVLLLVASITSPVINSLSLGHVTLTNQTSTGENTVVTFGSFGYCYRHVSTPSDSDTDVCTDSMIGYHPADVMARIEGTNFNVVASSTINSLPEAFVLHPIAAGIAFIAFLIALIPVWVASLLGAIVAIVAFIVSVIVMAFDFAVFGVINNRVNKDGTGSHSRYGTATWLVLAATIALFFGALITFFSCCSTRRSRKRASYPEKNYATAPNGVAPARRGFFSRFRRNRY